MNPNIAWSDEQLNAIDKMISFLDSPDRILVLTGYAGVGKTAVMNEFVQYLDSTKGQGYFKLCAPTHKAKAVLEMATGYRAITLHKLLALAPKLDIFNLDYKDLKFYSDGMGDIPNRGLIIVDEASMVSDELYDLLVEYCEFNNCKILFIGDIAQIAPVKNGGLSKVFSQANTVRLTKIFRQDENAALAPVLLRLRENPISRFETTIGEKGSLFCFNDTRQFMLDAVEEIKLGIKSNNVNHTKLIAYTNKRVRGFNQCVRRVLFNDNEPYHKFEFLTGYENFEYNGEFFYNSSDYVVVDIRKTDRNVPHFMRLPGFDLSLYDSVDKRLMNVFIIDPRDINPDYLYSLAQQIESIRLDAIQAKKWGNRTKSGYLWGRYFDIMKSFATPVPLLFDNRVIKQQTFDYGYAITAHRSQGSSYNKVFVDMGNLKLDRDLSELRQLQYVSLSRTKTDAYILT